MNNSSLIQYTWPLALSPARPDDGARSTSNSVDYEKLFVSLLPTIDKIVTYVCRRNHLREAEAEDFASEVKLHLIEGDYNALRRFGGRSTIDTFLTIVVHRLFLDYCNRVWGRWRPSAEAARLGPTGILLERLITRDGLSFDEAQELMRANYGIAESREALDTLWARLARRSSRPRFVSEKLAADVPSNAPRPDATILRAERDSNDQFVSEALERALQELTAEERLLLRMRYDDGIMVSQIARALHLDQKPLYRRFEQLCEQLKQRLERDGVSAEDIRKLFEDS
jgi:RNA polymerase sigma factor for flagellar operon FliA